jgi:DNA-binding MarR family transcriptional regulator
VGIEKDIQQSQFRNEFQKAAVNLLYTSGWLRDKMKVVFDKEEITAQQFNILRILRGSFPTPLSTLQIRDRMLEKMSDTSRLVDRLVVKGLVKKITAETDRRLVDVLITEKGKKLLSRIDAQETEMDAILNNLTEKEAEQLSELLDKMRSATG